MAFSCTTRGVTYRFDSLRTLLAKSTPARSGDELAGLAADSARERAAAQMALADTPLTTFLNEALVPYEADEVTRLIVDSHDAAAFQSVAGLTVGEFRDWLLSDDATGDVLSALSPGIHTGDGRRRRQADACAGPDRGRAQIHVVTRFRTTVGLPGRMSTRLQPNHPTDDPTGIAISMLDGLRMGSGDAVIGINPVSDDAATVTHLLRSIDHVRQIFDIPTQSCVLAHITTQMQAMHAGAPLDLLFQSIAGSEAANASFGVSLSLLAEGEAMARALGRGGIADETTGKNVMYFETGQGSALSANAHHGVDQQTMEARAYAVARRFKPMLVNTVVGFIGPEYLYDGKQIIRAGLEDHFAGKLLGLPMGCDVCYTNHAAADQDDMDTLLTLLGTAGVNYIMGVPGADDVMLHYQSTAFQDALYIRRVLGLRLRRSSKHGSRATCCAIQMWRGCSAMDEPKRRNWGPSPRTIHRRASGSASPASACPRALCSNSRWTTRWPAMPCRRACNRVAGAGDHSAWANSADASFLRAQSRGLSTAARSWPQTGGWLTVHSFALRSCRGASRWTIRTRSKPSCCAAAPRAAAAARRVAARTSQRGQPGSRRNRRRHWRAARGTDGADADRGAARLERA